MVRSQNFEDAYNKNQFNFGDHNLKYTTLFVDEKLVPMKPLSSYFANHLH